MPPAPTSRVRPPVPGPTPAAAVTLVTVIALATGLGACTVRPLPEAPRRAGLALAGGEPCFPGHPDQAAAQPWCQVSRRDGTVVISGLVASGPMAQAVPAAYGALARVLAVQRLEAADIVRETVWTPRLDEFLAEKDRRKAYLSPRLPQASWVPVRQLYEPGQALELEVTLAVGAR